MHDRTYVPLQPWSCDKCGARGDVEIPAGLDVVRRVERVYEDHRAKSPACADEWGEYALRFHQVASTLPE